MFLYRGRAKNRREIPNSFWPAAEIGKMLRLDSPELKRLLIINAGTQYENKTQID